MPKVLKISLIALAGLVLFLAPATQAIEVLSATAAETDPSCQFQDFAAALTEATKNPSEDYGEAVRVELKVRQNWLRAVLNCSIFETKKLQGALREFQTKDANLDKLRGELLNQLEDVSNYYDLQLTKVNDHGLHSIKDAARAIRDWRSGTHSTVAERGGNLMLWTKNQDLFASARSRYDLIGQTIRRLNLMEQEDIRIKYGSAEDFLKQAEQSNSAARGLLLRSANSDTTRVIKESLENLSQTYKFFFELSEDIKKLLPL
ncbi:MAG: hypothetical protein V1856_02175 [Candidatus Liptonbacteria bacterium]